MKTKMRLYYDAEGDFLEISFGKPAKGYFKDVGNGVSERIDEKTGKVTGVAILGFRKRAQKQQDLAIPLPAR